MAAVIKNLLPDALTGGSSATDTPAVTKKSKKSKKADANAGSAADDISSLDTSSQAVQPSEQTKKEVASAVESRGQKGVVEEVISKRLKALSKKISRIKTYSSQPPETLNADQKATLTTLPALEAVAKELDDLIKPGGPVETAELAQSSILREARETAEAKVETVSAQRVEEYQTSLATPLARFLRLHALLHPARPSDHSHITTGSADFDLPSQLREEVQASDVLRVGRLYEDLLRGGEEAKIVIAGLVKGPCGNEPENDHIHKLLELLDQPEISVPPTTAQSEVGHTEEIEHHGTTFGTTAQEEEEHIDGHDSQYGLPNGHHEHDARDDELSFGAEAIPEDVTTQGGSGTGALNFLQEDELVDGRISNATDFQDSYPTPQSLPPVPQQPASVPEPPQTVPLLSAFETAPGKSLDWTLDDDEDDHIPPVQSQEAATNALYHSSENEIPTEHVEPEPSKPEPIQSETVEDVSEPVVEPQGQMTSTSGKSVQPETAAPEDGGKIPTGPRRGRGGRPPQHQRQQQRQNQAQGQGQGQGPPQLATPVIVDADGFEQVNKRQGQGQGQGGRGRGFGDRVRGGAGRGRGQGRGGFQRNVSQNANDNSGQQTQNTQNQTQGSRVKPQTEQRKQVQGQGQRGGSRQNGPGLRSGQAPPGLQQKEKGSIYKSVTSSGVPAA